MIYLSLAMASVGLVAASILNWRIFLPLAALLFLASALSAAVWADQTIFFRGLFGYAAAQVGYVLGGIASSVWRTRRADHRSGVEHDARQHSN